MLSDLLLLQYMSNMNTKKTEDPIRVMKRFKKFMAEQDKGKDDKKKEESKPKISVWQAAAMLTLLAPVAAPLYIYVVWEIIHHTVKAISSP